MSRYTSPRLTAMMTALALLRPDAAARAQQDSGRSARDEADALYEQATRAMDARDWATACPKLEEVVKLAPAGVGARLTLARCYEGAGSLARAYESFEVAAATAARANRQDRAEEARDRARALQPKLGWLTIVVTDDVRALAGLEIRRDGVAVEPAAWGVAVAVDRGRHVVVATATGRRIFERSVEPDGDHARANVVVDVPVAAAAPPPPIAVAAPPRVDGRHVGGFLVGGAGIGSVAIGGVTGALALAELDAARRACPNHVCPTSSSFEHVTRGRSLAVASAITLAAGVLGTGVGLYLVLSGSGRSSAPRLGLTALPGGGQIGFRGTF